MSYEKANVHTNTGIQNTIECVQKILVQMDNLVLAVADTISNDSDKNHTLALHYVQKKIHEQAQALQKLLDT